MTNNSITLTDSDGEHLVLYRYRTGSGVAGFAIDAYARGIDDTPQVELRLSQQDIDRLKEWLNDDPR